MKKISIYWAGYHPETSIQAQTIHYIKQEFLKLYDTDIIFKFDTDIGTLGYKAIDLLKLVENGDIDCCYFYSSYLTERIPDLNIFELPFQIESRNSIYSLLDGDLGEYLAKSINDNTGYKLIGWWDNGIRHLSNNTREINNIDDCRDLVLRIAKNDIHRIAFNGMGFKTKFVDVKDLPNAISNKEIDAQENPLTNIINYGIEDYHKHITMTSHLYGNSVVLANNDTYYKWPLDFRRNLAKVIKKSTNLQRSLAISEDKRCLDYLINKGTNITYLNDKNTLAFKKISQELIEKTIKTFSPNVIGQFNKLNKA